MRPLKFHHEDNMTALLHGTIRRSWISKNLIELPEIGSLYSPSTWEGEAGGQRVQGQPGLHSETLSQKKKN
jgi:hypothetical protein